jgi:large subunit ribosomal protein L19
MAKKTIKSKKASKGLQLRMKGLQAKVALVDSSVAKSEMPDFAAGDTVKVHVRIKEGDKERVQAYEGLVIARGNSMGGKSFVVRKISHGVGVERIFMENSPRIARVEKVASGRVRRAKLYYIRGLEGKAAKIERELEVAAPASSGAKATEKASAKS